MIKGGIMSIATQLSSRLEVPEELGVTERNEQLIVHLPVNFVARLEEAGLLDQVTKIIIPGLVNCDGPQSATTLLRALVQDLCDEHNASLEEEEELVTL